MPTGKEHTTKKILRRLLQLVALLITILYYPIVMGFVEDEYSTVVCSDVDPIIIGNNDDVLISGNELNKIVSKSFPDIKGTKLCEINLNEIEQHIEQNTAVEKCECYSTPGGVIHVKVQQRKPIMHVFTKESSYYMDGNGFRIPVRNDTRAHALVVNGNVGTMLDVDDLIKLCKFIKEDDFWKAQIEQVYVTDKTEYILVPRVGDHVIELGGIDRLGEKFELLNRLYTKGWDKKEWNLYKKVSLKYRGQVVCTKK